MEKLTPLGTCDAGAIETLLDAAFGEDRKGRTAYMLRDGVNAIDALCFGLIAGDGELIGSIQCWPVAVTTNDSEVVPLILVGPVAVAPDLQNRNHGHQLMDAMLEAAMLEGNPPLMMIGDAEYYRRFGFSASETDGWDLPGPFEAHRLLLRNEGEYILPRNGMIGPDVGN